MHQLERDLKTPKRLTTLKNPAGLIVTGTADDPLSVSSSNVHNSDHGSHATSKAYSDNSSLQTVMNSQVCKSSFYRHKMLLRLRNKRVENNYDLGMYLLIRFGGPESSGGSIILGDAELLQCSALSKFRNDEDLKRWYKIQHAQLLKHFKGVSKHLDPNKLNRRLAKMLAPTKWCNREKLKDRIREQSSWNPFSIFGSSLPYVNIADIFNRNNTHEFMDNACVEKLKVLAKNVPIEDYLQNRWTSEASPSINWSKDPLHLDEVLWYLQATDRYSDKSRSVCILQPCFCVTPNPRVAYNWNDPRCSIWKNYKGPRPSMGEVLSASIYKSRTRYFKNLQMDVLMQKSPRATLSNRNFATGATRAKLRLHNYYKRYFGVNRINLSCTRLR
ncbi:hypothetical protein BdWA1_001171 [Babesia duncani]|uniref:Uncharacterized protein n=1 Tax=Babesia duncani TaxID=323732 RepID=A0AAD9UQS0_9APIC|nr:hypothetical protein BdWA1_001171 [Babesia duncani]